MPAAGQGSDDDDKDIVTLAVHRRTMKVIGDFAAGQGLDARAYINSVLEPYANWYIPVRSFDPVTVPKKMLSALFGMATHEQLDALTRQWAVESKNILMLSGADFNLETALTFARLISKYFVGGDARMIDSQDKNKNVVSMVVRHDAGNTFPSFAPGASATFSTCSR